MFPKSLLLSLCLCAFSCQLKKTSDEFTSIFNGKNFDGWQYYLGVPDSSSKIDGLAKDSNGLYSEPVGFNEKDPTKVFSVVTVDGAPALRISGEIIGTFGTVEEYENYHLTLEFKWGNIKWQWLGFRPKDGGILYHWTRKGVHEFQIHEGDVGSYWSFGPIVKSYAIKQGNEYVFNHEKGVKTIFSNQKGGNQICLRNPVAEKPSGEWNTLELICFEDKAIHIVNGKVNMAIFDSKVMENGNEISFTKGKIQLQSEGAEILFRNIHIRKLEKLPKEYEKYVSAGDDGYIDAGH